MDLYYDEKFKNNVIEAWKANINELDNIYHHPTTKGIVEKCIDLSCKKPLTEKHTPDKIFGLGSTEKWLEAYIIQTAKKSNQYKSAFQFNGITNHYYFLYSQLNFKGIRRPLDCMLYEPATQNLIILELKANRALKCAKEELEKYTEEIRKIKHEIKEVFEKIYNDFEGISGIEGYIVWPENIKGRQNLFDGWGVIEYSSEYDIIRNGNLVEPWQHYIKVGDKMTINFKKVIDSKIIK